MDDNLFEFDQDDEGVDELTPLGGTAGGPAITTNPFVRTHNRSARTRPRESKYDVGKAAAVSSKLDFSDETLLKLVKALKPDVVKPKKLSRSLLPKLNYSKQIMVNQQTFASWVEQIKVYTYSRRWPARGARVWEEV